MAESRKHNRTKKCQLGQFFTPDCLAERVVDELPLTIKSRVLEPGCGSGNFIKALIHKFDELHSAGHRLYQKDRFRRIVEHNVSGVEIDIHAFNSMQSKIENWYRLKWWNLSFADPSLRHNLVKADFLLHNFGDIKFDAIAGNPPFGGTIDLEHQDMLDKKYGRRGPKKEWKIKKETYSFFMVKSVDLLKDGGILKFICSDTFLTIKTMSGLRRFLMSEGQCEIERLDYFSEETSYPMVVFTFIKSGPSDHIILDKSPVYKDDMEKTGNFSWTVDAENIKYFNGQKIGDLMVCTSGMTTGKNEYFVREIKDGKIVEDYSFEFFQDPITLEKETERARLNKISPEKQEDIKKQESLGETRRNVRISKTNETTLNIPHPNYCYYNKGGKQILYEAPSHVIYWKDDGDAVYTFKKNGNWYLHGVGGKPFFKREGITWPLISSKIRMRYLPPGYILDSGAPCGFLRDGVDPDELYFILGWCLTDKANHLLKEFINHTQNIQGKDVERLPYPHWVDAESKAKAISSVKNMIERSKSGEEIDFDNPDVIQLNEIYKG
jgi:hypothetical protein